MKYTRFSKNEHRSGFTIVELLIVVVVIAILAAITIVSFGNVQKQARDTKRVDDVAKITKAFQLWGTATGGTFTTMQAGSGADENGWFDTAYTPYVSVKSVLVSSGYLSEGVVDPQNIKGSGNSYAYMITPCSSSEPNIRVILARLENPPSQTVEQQIGRTCLGGSFSSYTTTYAMNYGRIIDLQP